MHVSQVFFILGNRDLMKLRFMAELAEVEPVGQIWLPTWDPKVVTFERFLEENQEGTKMELSFCWGVLRSDGNTGKTKT